MLERVVCRKARTMRVTWPKADCHPWYLWNSPVVEIEIEALIELASSVESLLPQHERLICCTVLYTFRPGLEYHNQRRDQAVERSI